MKNQSRCTSSREVVVTLRDADSFAVWLWTTYAAPHSNAVPWLRLIDAKPRLDGQYRVRIGIATDHYAAIKSKLPPSDDIEDAIHDALFEAAQVCLEREIASFHSESEPHASSRTLAIDDDTIPY